MNHKGIHHTLVLITENATFQIIGFGEFGCEVVETLLASQSPSVIETFGYETAVYSSISPILISEPKLGSEQDSKSRGLLITNESLLFVVADLEEGTDMAFATEYLSSLPSAWNLVTGVLRASKDSQEAEPRGEGLKRLDDFKKNDPSIAQIFDARRVCGYLSANIGILSGEGLITLDMADWKGTFPVNSESRFGFGRGIGNHRDEEAAIEALYDLSGQISGFRLCKSVLICVDGGNDLTLGEVGEIAKRITDQMNDDAAIIVGSRIMPSLGSEIVVSITVRL